MDDYRNNFKVEKAIKTAFYRDRARIQVGRISMFGLLELSRQRLRSSLIDRSFEKCHYCRGSGLILNPTSISEQIIKVLNEKLSNNNNLKIYNSLVVVDNNLNVLNYYHKNNLVPFGEFLPMENFLKKIGLKTITNNYQSFSKGKVRKIISIKNKNFVII